MNVIELIKRLTDLNRDGELSQALVMVMDEENEMYLVRDVATVGDIEDNDTVWIEVESF